MNIRDIISLPKDLQGPNKKLRLKFGEDLYKLAWAEQSRVRVGTATTTWPLGDRAGALSSSSKDSGYALVLTLARICSYPQVQEKLPMGPREAIPRNQTCCFLTEMSKQPQEHGPLHN